MCGISPLDIPHMTPFQIETLIIQHNKQMDKEQKELEEIQDKAKNVQRKARRR